MNARRYSPSALGSALCAICALVGLAAGDAIGAAELPSAVPRVVSAVTPALVRIHVVEVSYYSGREMKSEITGSGVILTRDGHAITNHHVAGNVKQITCTLASKEEIEAELVGTDPLTDICVIKLKPDRPRDFQAATFGDSDALAVGDPVLAMGSPLALSQSVTMGVVSNTELVMPDLIWPFRFEVEGEDVGAMVRWIGHDAEISLGNSGGPLVNMQGEVVGINELQFGLGAAIPGNLARQVAEQIIREGKVVRAWLGLDVQPLLRSQERREGVLIGGVIPGSPAEAAGFASGDVLIVLGGEAVTVGVPEELPLFNQFAAALPVGREVQATVLRGGAEKILKVVPREREARQPKEREFSQWGMTARNLSSLEAKEMRRESHEGVLVTSLRQGGPCDAAKPRISERDVIVEVAGTPVVGVADLAAVSERVTRDESDPVPVVVVFDRRAERYLTVVKVGKQEPPEPGREVPKAWLGVAPQVLTREIAEALDLGEVTGVRVTLVMPGSPAEEAGLAVGDFILRLDGQPIRASRPEHFEVFPAMIRQYRAGSEVELGVLREGKEMTLSATLASTPQSPREMDRYQDDNFEFAVRDIAFDDRTRNQWSEEVVGPLVERVSEGGWAAVGHLAVGDVILEVAGRPTREVAGLEEVMKAVAAEMPRTVVFRVRRGIHEIYLELKPQWSDDG